MSNDSAIPIASLEELMSALAGDGPRAIELTTSVSYPYASVMRFKRLDEMNPLQLRATSVAPDTRRLVRLTVAAGDDTDTMMDMMLAEKRAPDRKRSLERNGDLADV